MCAIHFSNASFLDKLSIPSEAHTSTWFSRGRSALTGSQVRKRVGYCPSFNALPGYLTGREVVTLYARIRGIPESRIPATCIALAKIFYFHFLLDRKLNTYRLAETKMSACCPRFKRGPELAIPKIFPSFYPPPCVAFRLNHGT